MTEPEGGAREMVVHERATPDARCAYCHDLQRGALQACARCGAVMHVDCGAALGRCTTLGCGTAGLAAEPEPVFRPRARWFDLRDAHLRADALRVVGWWTLVAGFMALFLAARYDRPSDALDPTWWGGLGALTLVVMGALLLPKYAAWRRARRIVAATRPQRRYVTLGRAGRDGWRLLLRAHPGDISPAEVIHMPVVDDEPPPAMPWLQRLAPLTPMTVHGLDVTGSDVALVDAEGRLHAMPPARRVDA